MKLIRLALSILLFLCFSMSAEVTHCWPSIAPETGGLITNDSADTLTWLTSADSCDDLEFRFKARNHRNPEKSVWGIMVKGENNRELTLTFKSREAEYDGISTARALEITTAIDGTPVGSEQFSEKAGAWKKLTGGAEGPDPTGLHNFFKINIKGDNFNLMGGNHHPTPLLNIPLPEGFKCDSIGFFLMPGSAISFSELRLTIRDLPEAGLWNDRELMEEYFANSEDSMEGYWRILDRSLDESYLKLGGDYLLGIVKAGSGYDIIYISGATVNSDRWTSGMIKGHLSPSGIAGVWNAEWTDSMFQPLNSGLKAQRDANGTLTIQFPYQASQLRLHPSSLRPAGGNDR